MAFDLDALIAQRTAARVPFTFTFGETEYVLPGSIDLRAAAALSAGKLYDGLQMLLGVTQWERMQASDQVFDGEALRALLDAYMAHTGVSLGESSASTGSARSTGGRSKPTSNGSTKRTLVT